MNKKNFINKRSNIILFAITTMLVVLLVFVTFGYSWWGDSRNTYPNIRGNIQGSYFESGDGSAESPYEIARPVQLYYFAWLQDLGTFNDVSNNTISQKYFILSADLDMSAYKLPPIGTATYPFVGNFDGQNHKISGLTVSNIAELTDVPSITGNYELNGYQIVGFFGVVGSVDGTTDDDGNTLGTVTIGNSTYTYSSAVNEIKNFLLDSVTIESLTPTDNRTLIGIAAGYVDGNMSHIGVYNSSLSLASGLSALDGAITDKKSAYSLIGYSKDAYDQYIDSQSQGTGSAWGGSVDMETLHKRLTVIYGTAGNNGTTNGIGTDKNITYARDYYNFYDENGNYVGNVAGSDTSQAKFIVYDYNSSAGAFTFAQGSSGNYTNKYYYMSGGVRTTVSREYYYADQTAYSIQDSTSGIYLTYDSEHDALVASSSATNSKFFRNNNTYYIEKNTIPSANPTTNYYINKNAYGALVLSTGSLAWTSGNNGLYNDNEYIVNTNGASGGFGLTDGGTVYKIGYNGTYLNYGSTSSITAGNSEAGATEWLYSSGYIHTVMNGVNYYLGYSGENITLSTAANTTWTISGGLIGCAGGYIDLVNGSWKLVQVVSHITDGTPLYITDGTNYLNSNLGNTTSKNSATQWTYDGTYIKTATGNTYLRNNNGTLATTTSQAQATAWTYQNNTISSGEFSITYSSGWKLSYPGKYIAYVNGNTSNYISFNGNITNITSQSNASIWIFSNESGSGTVSTYYNGNQYYLRNNGGTLTYTTDPSQASLWEIENGLLKSDGYVLKLNNNTWSLVYPKSIISYEYVGRYSATFYMRYNNGSLQCSTTNNNNEFTVQETNNGVLVYYVNGNSNYYLRDNNGTLQLDTNLNNATYWSLDNGILSDANYFLDVVVTEGNNSVSGTWKLVSKAQDIYYLYDGTYYLSGTNGSYVQASSTQSSAMTFTISSQGYLSPSSDSSYYVVYRNNDTYIYNTTTNRFVFDESTGYISMRSGNTTRYLYPKRQSSGAYYFEATNNQKNASTFTKIKVEGKSLTITPVDDNTELTITDNDYSGAYFESTATYYTSAAHNISIGNTTNKHLTYRTSNFQYVTESSYIDYENIDFNNTWVTYFPINADDTNNYQAVNSNTGYIVSGSGSSSTGQYGGDIRISDYAKFRASYSGGVYRNNMGYSLSDDNVIDSTKTYTINGSGSVTVASLGEGYFARYSEAKTNFESILQESTNQSSVYGLHFMNSLISMDHIVTAKTVLINGSTMTNYELPANSIDFNLKKKGYINFLAGTYFNGNNSFFSLHKVVRNTDSTSPNFRKITAIKEILGVYGINDPDEAESAKYIYQVSYNGSTSYEYSDGTAAQSVPNNYTLLFNSAWIKENTLVTGSETYQGNTYTTHPIYYFEIPMDPGEYCLGSVDGANGAYLLYLDIAANAGDLETDVVSFVSGIDFLSAADVSLLSSINKPTAVYSLKDTFASVNPQAVTFSRVDTTPTSVMFTVTGSTANQKPNMKVYYNDEDGKDHDTTWLPSS